MKLLVIIPTYNEIENITKIVPEVFKNIPENSSVLIIDDSSPDGTAQAVKEMQKQYGEKLILHERPSKSGVASAFIGGEKWGMENGFDVLCAMDSDFSHKPEYLKTFCKEIEDNDIIIGSRFVKGGRIEGRSAFRNLISKLGCIYTQIVLGVPIKDFTGGYNMFRKEALEKIDLNTISSKGYSFQLEWKYKAYKLGCKIKEVPIIFPDRVFGESKISGSIFTEAFTMVWKIRKQSNLNPK